MSSEMKLRFMSWNSNGLKTKMEKVKSEIKKHNCDVVFMQQTRSGASETFKELENESFKSFYTKQTDKEITGVAILIKTDICSQTNCVSDVVEDAAGCYIVVKCTLKGQLFTLVSVYNCLWNLKPLLKLSSVLEKHANGILLIGGDFNVPLNPYLDRISTKNDKTHAHLRPVVKEFMTSFHLVDVWRRLHPNDKKYSYQQKDVKSRLDYIFVPEVSTQYINMCEISHDCSGRSDHYPVVTEIGMFNEESKLEIFLIILNNSSREMYQNSVVNEWLSCKRKHWPNLDLPANPHASPMISAIEIQRAIQSLVLKHVEHPDGIPLSFYKSYSQYLFPYLCDFYQNILEQPNIPEAFSKSILVSETHHIYNVDYLILASIMARWLDDHLQSLSSNYTNVSDKTTVLFFHKIAPINVECSVLTEALGKNPQLDEFKIAAVQKILKSNSNDKQKCLYWGCPLTQVLVTLYITGVAKETVKNVGDENASMHISRENVIVEFSGKYYQNLLEKRKGKYTNIYCKTLENNEDEDDDEDEEKMPSLEDLNLSEKK